MLSFDPYRLFSRALPPALFLATAHLLSASTLYQYALPTTNLNQAAGTSRSNASLIGANYGTVDGAADIIGDDFVLNSTSVITSLTVYAIADSADPDAGTLDQQFTSISLYTGASSDFSAPVTLTSTLDSAQLALAPIVYYTGTTDYQTLDTPGTAFFSIYAVTFTGLDWSVPAGQLSYFGIGSVPIGGNSLALSISLDPNANLYDPFLIYTGNPYTPTYEDTGTDVCGFDAYGACGITQTGSSPTGGYSVVNVDIEGSTPEPSTLGLLGLGIGALALKLRRRK